MKKVFILCSFVIIIFLPLSLSAMLVDGFDWVESTIKLKNIPVVAKIFISCGTNISSQIPAPEVGFKDKVTYALLENISEKAIDPEWKKTEALNYNEIVEKVQKNLLRYRAEVEIQSAQEGFYNYNISCSKKESTLSFE